MVLLECANNQDQEGSAKNSGGVGAFHPADQGLSLSISKALLELFMSLSWRLEQVNSVKLIG